MTAHDARPVLLFGKEYFTATDYGALRAEVERLRPRANCSYTQAEFDEVCAIGLKHMGRAEAAEARVARFVEVINRWGSWHDGCFYYNRIAAPELGAALNDQGQDNG